VLSFLTRTTLARLIYREPVRLHWALANITHIYCKKVLRTFNVTVHISGTEELANPEPCLIVSNHLSYIDILVVSSLRPTLFLSHTGIEAEPFVGRLAANGGTLFVNKSSKSKLEQEMNRLADILKQGVTMTLFPEGGIGSGLEVMPFHSSFIAAAAKSSVPVLPICLQYEKYNGEPVTATNKDNIIPHGAVSLLPHIVNIFKSERSIDLSIHVFDRISTQELSRKEISNTARDLIAGKFKGY
jgi:1-acyl-sn-glycerol-3-phosphate acyltransferase